MEKFLKKMKTSAQDDIASPSHEPDDPPAPPYSSGSEAVYLFW